jgi:heme/copper-type cytochrome/quinol oxidase subunit 1
MKDHVDIHLHDTYYVIANVHIYWTIALFLLLEWAIYSVAEKFLWTRYLTWLHIVVTVAIIGYCFTPTFQQYILPLDEPVSYQQVEAFYHEQYKRIILLASLMTGAQLLFMINFFGGAIVQITKREHND